MSRLRNYARGVLSSYAQLGANVLYSLVSIPLALSFLPRREFGLWALLMPIVAYVSLVDFGMTSAVSRLLIDHKDQRQGKTYGALIKTAFAVGVVQGVIVFSVIALCAPAMADVLKVPPGYAAMFVTLLRIQGGVSAFGFAVRPFSLVLTAHQRMDLCSYGDIFFLLSSLGWLWFFLFKGLGVFSFVYATAISTVLVPIYLAIECKNLKLFPHAGEWGKITGKLFREVFSYGKDVFLIAVGTQMILASQTLIVSRRFGLDAAATWAVGTKVFNLLGQLAWRLIAVSMPALAEMITRAERQRLAMRFHGLVAVTASFSAFLGISLALCNSVFVNIWTAGKISWLPLNDVLLGSWLCLLSLQGIHNNLVIATKQIRMLRYVYFLEGCTFLAVTILVGSRFGMPGIIATSIFCTTAFSLSYGIWRSSHYFGRSWSTVAFNWTSPGITVAAAFGAIAAVVWNITNWLPPVPRLVINASIAIVGGGFLLLRVGVPREMRQELATRSPRAASQLLRYLAPYDQQSDRVPTPLP